MADPPKMWEVVSAAVLTHVESDNPLGLAFFQRVSPPGFYEKPAGWLLGFGADGLQAEHQLRSPTRLRPR